MSPVQPQPRSPALARIRVPVPSHPSASETVNLTAEQMKAELDRLRAQSPSTQPPESSSVGLYVGIVVGAIVLALVALLIASPQLPTAPPAPKPLSGYAP